MSKWSDEFINTFGNSTAKIRKAMEQMDKKEREEINKMIGKYMK